jgi:hypothetical protein
MTHCHIAFWALSATLDHLEPIARGGADVEGNLVTTSMARNSAKANFTLEEIGWDLKPPGDFKAWDGMVGWYLRFADRYTWVLENQPYRSWRRAALRVMG